MYKLKLLSSIVGKIAQIRLPKIIRKPLFSVYVSLYKVNLSEIPRTLDQFSSFQDFFTREINPELRPISPAKYVSPVDGLLVDYGIFKSKNNINVKSLSYYLSDFINDNEISYNLENGLYIILYLSPRDYHRIHCPTNSEYLKSFLISGDLKTVNPNQGENLAKVLSTNERLVTVLKNEEDKVYALVKVGATNVGSISYSNKWSEIIKIKKGVEIAKFNLGSTVVLCLPDGSFSEVNLKLNKHYKMGEELEIK